MTKKPDSKWGPSTKCIWGGEEELPPQGSTVMPVFHGVTYAYDGVGRRVART